MIRAPALERMGAADTMETFVRWLLPTSSSSTSPLYRPSKSLAGVHETKHNESAPADTDQPFAAPTEPPVPSDATAALRVRVVVAAVARWLRRDIVSAAAVTRPGCLLLPTLQRLRDALFQLPVAFRADCASPTDVVRCWPAGRNARAAS